MEDALHSTVHPTEPNAELPQSDGFGSTSSEGRETPIPVAQRERHPKLWFNDGTIVLATPKMLFRVYGGMLAYHSPLFRDAFSLPQPEANAEAVDGAPVIHLADDPVELAHLLSALHFRSYYSDTKPTDFATVSAILHLSTKYQIQELHQQAISQFASLCPDTLEAFDDFRSESLLVQQGSHDDFDMVHVARKTESLQLLPVLFYRIAMRTDMRADLGVKTDSDSRLYELSKDDIINICMGREKLRQAVRKELGKTLFGPSHCGYRDQTCIAHKGMFVRSDTWIGMDECPNVLDPSLYDTWRVVLEKQGLCGYCLKALKTSMDIGRRTIWTNLPGYFGLPDWERLRAITTSSVEEIDADGIEKDRLTA